MKLLVPRRRLLKAAAIGIAMPYVRRVDAAAAFSGFMVAGTNAFPGQPGNPVGFAAAPGWTGSFATGPITFAAYAALQPGGVISSGSAGSPHVISFVDFDAGNTTTTSNITTTGGAGAGQLSYVKFVGCRFQSNADASTNWNVNLQASPLASDHITFSYCSFTPRTAIAPSIPNPAWPSASAGTGINYASAGRTSYMIPQSNGYPFGVDNFWNIAFLMDHCDMWGWGNATNITPGNGANVVFSSCWIHDAREPGSGGSGDHTDGIGYLGVGAAPSNVTVTGCTIASIGNTNGIALQTSASGSANNITVTGNYLSGFGVLIRMFNPPVSANTNMTFTDNVIATDLYSPLGLVYDEPSGGSNKTQFTSTSNLWRRNKLRVYPGDTWSGFSSGQNGQYVWPDASINASDWTL
jgi:hypothetical protein